MNLQDQKTTSISIVRGGLQRPTWVCRNVRQNVVFVRDASESMRGQKAKDALSASLELVAELAAPENKDGFRVAIVDFAHRSKIVHQLEKATVLNGKIAPLFIEGDTNITAGLEDTDSILEKAGKPD